MNTTKKLKNFGRYLPVALLLFMAVAIVGVTMTVMSDSALAQPQAAPDIGTDSSSGGGGNDDNRPETSILPNDLDVIGLLKFVIWVMTAGIGVLAVAGIVWGSILYATAGTSQENTKKGIEIIKNVVIGLLLYVFMFAIVNFLIPGRLIT